MVIRTRSAYPLIVLAGIFLLITDSCSKSTENPVSNIPVTPVNFSINPSSTEYYRLNNVSGYEYLTGGYSGILVYRISVTEFVAFERACPYDWEKTEARVVVNSSGLLVDCPSCKSQFSIIDGTPVKGVSKYPLKQFQTSYDGTLLYIFN